MGRSMWKRQGLRERLRCLSVCMQQQNWGIDFNQGRSYSSISIRYLLLCFLCKSFEDVVILSTKLRYNTYLSCSLALLFGPVFRPAFLQIGKMTIRNPARKLRGERRTAVFRPQTDHGFEVLPDMFFSKNGLVKGNMF